MTKHESVVNDPKDAYTPILKLFSDFLVSIIDTQSVLVEPQQCVIPFVKQLLRKAVVGRFVMSEEFIMVIRVLSRMQGNRPIDEGIFKAEIEELQISLTILNTTRLNRSRIPTDRVERLLLFTEALLEDRKDRASLALPPNLPA